MDRPWKVIFAFVGVFVAGAVFGGFFTLRSSREGWSRVNHAQRTEPSRPNSSGAQIVPAMLRQLNARLKLTDEQREKIEPIVVRAEEDLQRLRRQNFRETSRVMERMHADVAVLLAPEQREALETLKRNLRERLRRAQENRERRGEFLRGAQGPGSPGARPGGETAAAEERKGN